MRKILAFVIILTVSFNVIFPSKSAAVELSTGSTIYVPIYMSFYQIYASSKESYGLNCTVCLHNTDPKRAIVVYAIDHYDSNGKLLKNLLFEPITIKPWTSKELTFEPNPQPEYFGANLIVRWKVDQPANPPLVEVMMTGYVLNRGVSFLTRGQEIKE